MENNKSLNLEIAEFLQRVELTPKNDEGHVPIFGEQTHVLARGFYDLSRTYIDNSFYAALDYYPSMPEVRIWGHEQVSLEAKLGALAAKLKGMGQFYDLGAGVCIASLAFLKLTGKPAIALDKESRWLEIGKKVSRELNSDENLEIVLDKAEEYIQTKSFSSEDTIFMNGPTGTLDSLWPKMIKDLPCRFILGLGLEDCYVEDYSPQYLEAFRNSGKKFEILMLNPEDSFWAVTVEPSR